MGNMILGLYTWGVGGVGWVCSVMWICVSLSRLNVLLNVYASTAPGLCLSNGFEDGSQPF